VLHHIDLPVEHILVVGTDLGEAHARTAVAAGMTVAGDTQAGLHKVAEAEDMAVVRRVGEKVPHMAVGVEADSLDMAAALEAVRVEVAVRKVLVAEGRGSVLEEDTGRRVAGPVGMVDSRTSVVLTYIIPWLLN